MRCVSVSIKAILNLQGALRSLSLYCGSIAVNRL